MSLSTRLANAEQVTICSVDFGSDYFAYWIGRLFRNQRTRDGSRVRTLAWRIDHPSKRAPSNSKDKMWRERVLRQIMHEEPILQQVNLYDVELQNPMGVSIGPGRRGPGNPVAYGMSRTFMMYVETKNEELSQEQRKEIVSTHGVQKFNTFGVYRPSVGTDGQRKYRRKRTAVCFIKNYLRAYPEEGAQWMRVLEQNPKKQDDLSDVMWAGLSRAVRIYREWNKKRRVGVAQKKICK